MLTFRDSGWNERHYDGKSSVFIAGNVPEEFVEQAKDIDGQNYSEKCFSIEVYMVGDEIFIDKDYVCNGEIKGVGRHNWKSGELFYVDNNGNCNFMGYKLSEEERDAAIKLFNEVWSEE